MGNSEHRRKTLPAGWTHSAESRRQRYRYSFELGPNRVRRATRHAFARSIERDLGVLQQLGFNDYSLDKLNNDLLERSYGIVLVTGPTGSGKSTTLYAMFDEDQ